jgi:ATP-binding cassette subfamily F protein 3
VPILAATNVHHAFGDSVVLDGCTFVLEPGERVGIVGRNGAGKSTLLRALTGELRPDRGEVSTQRGARVGFLAQEPNLPDDETLRDAAEGAFEKLHALHVRLHAVYDEMAEAEGNALERLMRQQERLEREIEAEGGYAVDHRIDATLHGLGFTDAQFGIRVGDLSGGQRARLCLARLLLETPDALILDEPTNHLDLQGRLWLETFLADEYRGAVVMISHDRYMLDRVVTRIVEIEDGRSIDYPGNYHAFRDIRRQRRLGQLRAYEKQQTKWKREEAFIRKYKAGQRAKQARGRESRLERERTQAAVERPMEMATMRLALPRAERSGDIVASASGVGVWYENDGGSTKTLFRDLDLRIERGERWGIIGPNGAGKTTLVRCLLGEREPDAGSVRVGTNVRVGHFRQTSDDIDPDLQVYRYLQRIVQRENPEAPLSEQQARDLAGAFLFSGAEQERDLGTMSGGERARARLAGLLASSKNLLVLDEPTNHLDIPSAERLEGALALPEESTSERAGREGGVYEGTLVLISHDRALIDACCDHLLVLDGEGGAEVFLGNYTAWREREGARAGARAEAEAEARREREREEKRRRADEEARRMERKSRERGRSRLERMGTDEIERRIEAIERRVGEIDTSMGEPEVWQDHARAERLGAERAELVAELEPLEFEWARRAEAG